MRQESAGSGPEMLNVGESRAPGRHLARLRASAQIVRQEDFLGVKTAGPGSRESLRRACMTLVDFGGRVDGLHPLSSDPI